MYTNGDEEDPNEKHQEALKPKSKPKLKVKKGGKNKIKGTLLAKQKISLICMVVLLMAFHTMMQN